MHDLKRLYHKPVVVKLSHKLGLISGAFPQDSEILQQFEVLKIEVSVSVTLRDSLVFGVRGELTQYVERSLLQEKLVVRLAMN